MSKKNKISDYRRRGHLIPIIPWAYDILMPIAFSLVLAVAVAGGYQQVTSAQTSFENIKKEPEVYVPYLDLESQKSLGRVWAENFIKIAPIETSKWEVDSSALPKHPFEPKTCAYMKEFSTSLNSTHVGTGETTEVRIQVYGAGQSTKNFHLYAENLLKCFNGEISTDKANHATILKFDNHFMFAMGDVIISAKTSDNTRRDQLLDYYISETAISLLNSECNALGVTTADANRSFFYNPEEYSGLNETVTLKAETNISEIPTPTSVAMLEILNKNAKQPELPLPESFLELPEPMDRPLAPESIPDRTVFETMASYLVADLDGPGCGWAWSSQGQPVYDMEQLEKDRIETVSNQQFLINSEAEQYVDAKIDWAFQVGLLASEIDNWNVYVSTTNQIHEQWRWLKSERAKIRSAWFDYVSAHKEWQTFDERKAEAVANYENAIAECVAKQESYDRWDQEWGILWAEQQEYLNNRPTTPPTMQPTTPPTMQPTVTPEPTETVTEPVEPNPSVTPEPTSSPTPTETVPVEPEPTPTPEPPIATMFIPSPPEICETEPLKPEIVDQEKPAEPVSPAIPENVTIPESWEKP